MHIWYLPASPSLEFPISAERPAFSFPGALTVTLHCVVIALVCLPTSLGAPQGPGLCDWCANYCLLPSTVSRGQVRGDHLNVCWMNWLSFICPSASFLSSLQYTLTKPSEVFLPEVSFLVPFLARCLGSWARPSSLPISALAEASWSPWVQLNVCQVKFWEDGGSSFQVFPNPLL